MNDRRENIPADTVVIMECVDDGIGGEKPLITFSTPSITFSTIKEIHKQNHIIGNKIEGDGFSILPGSVIFVPYGYHFDDNGRYPRYLKLVAKKEYTLKPKDEDVRYLRYLKLVAESTTSLGTTLGEKDE